MKILILAVLLTFAIGGNAQSGVGGGGQSNVSGGSSASGGTGSPTNPAGPVMALYFTNACPTSNTGQCYFTPSNTQIANDCTWSSGSTTVTCATAHFVSTDVGKRVAGYFKTDVMAGSGCIAGRISFTSMTTGTLTINGFTSATQISLSANPSNTATGNTGCVIWGTPDDANASTFETAYSAISAYCPKVMLAAAGYWFSSPHFSSQPTGCAALPSLVQAPSFGNMVYTAGFELEGRGPGNTTIWLGPDFPNGDACTRSQGAITNACFLVPVEGKWKDLQISGGAQLTCQVPSGRNLIGVTVGTLENITLTNFCQANAGGQVGIKADSIAQLYQVNNSGFGSACLQTVANSGYVQAFKLACENSPGNASGNSVDILAGSGATPTFTCWGCLLLGAISSGSMNVVNVAAGANVRLIGTVLANCEAGSGCTDTAVNIIRNQGGNLYLTDSVMTPQGTANIVNGLFNSTSGAFAYVQRSILAATSGNFPYADAAGTTLVDLGGNSLGLATSTMNGTIQADGRSLMFSCTGTANASATNSLFGTGTNVTATTCAGQTATLGNGIPFQQARTIAAVKCTSSATTVSVACTVVVNGTPTSTTCTMTAATSCTNFTTTAVNPADLLSARIVTGAAETGANIKMQVIWQ